MATEEQYPCIICKAEVKQRQQALQCDSCEQWQHRTCNSGNFRLFFFFFFACQFLTNSFFLFYFQVSPKKYTEKLSVMVLKLTGSAWCVPNILSTHSTMIFPLIHKLIALICQIYLHLSATFKIVIWRKVQELGLQVAYNSDDKTHKYIKKLLALPYLPAEHINTVFIALQEKAVTEPLQELTTYISNTWLNSSIWPITSWSVFGRYTRTNNDRRMASENEQQGKERTAFLLHPCSSSS